MSTTPLIHLYLYCMTNSEVTQQEAVMPDLNTIWMDSLWQMRMTLHQSGRTDDETYAARH